MKISRGLNQLVDNLTKQYGGKKWKQEKYFGM
jgi:hypothetical protein